MKIVDKVITIEELQQMSEKMFGQIVKAVVDIEKEIMAVNAEMHADQEEFLLDQGSEQNNLWGINFHPFNDDSALVEFDSMINLRPSWGNKTRSVDDPAIRAKIMMIVNKLVKR
jgi:hypothetical protein